ncbi:type I-E CRISPR-associated protein Cse1/CasA [Acetobacter aceti]|uniref:Type I-E CRISPR-associated protein Cse1/CasA n=1 Tax=Acetobacter aceti TaxID=435 RepID=A0A6S6PFE2_ACEAC|nr:type I-E CRISPR-associated protein Cse1/CasA [Acetobacter aceti]BCI67687.1 type I-E CRISPR-associated protein Cse1/CasA [Acetobacter aceti]
MSLNLINDPWIPVLCTDGSHRIIVPWQMAEPDVVQPDWPRPDLNIACLELLIGLVFLADPPADSEDWDARRDADPQRLQEKLAPYAPAFNLLGDGPRFLQDLEPLTGGGNPVDMLFIDSAGANTARNNADVMVHRSRYDHLDFPLAAMALYTFQADAPSGGAGNRTSMRGGGPLVTLIDPEQTLWDMVWANVPCGQSAKMENLPWMRPTRVSDKGQQTCPPEGELFGAEAFFGMPRRLRLLHDEEAVTGVIQKPWGTNYALWKHPLSPYYRLKPGTEWRPKHPRAGHFGYRNWLGVVLEKSGGELSELALCLRDWDERKGGGSVIVAGWSMDNMKPRDFILSRQRLLSALSVEAEDQLVGLIQAAEAVAVALRNALAPVLAGGEAREAEREEFFLRTETKFLTHAQAIERGEDPARAWLHDLRTQALGQFDAKALPGLNQREVEAIGRITEARRYLVVALAGYGKQGSEIFNPLGLPLPETRKRKAA